MLAADALTCADGRMQRTAADLLGASLEVASGDASVAIDGLVRGLTPEPGVDGLRVLMLGPVNSPHLEQLAIAMHHRGHAVRVGGAVWGGLGHTCLPAFGIAVSTMTWPKPAWVRRMVGAFRADIVHANWMPFAADAAVAGARPLVATAWGSDVFQAGRLHDLANRFSVRRADALLADSKPLASRLVELGAPRERVSVLNWGVDTRMFRPTRSAGEKSSLRRSLGLDDGPVILSPRGLAPLYNPRVILDAFRQVLEVVPDAHLVLKHQSDRPSEIDGLRTTPQIHVVGRVDYAEMAYYFRAADVCVSIAQSDSSPRSVWEAMASGCACVVSDLPWVHDLIEHEAHALITPIDPGAVARSIIRLLTTPPLHAKIVANGYALVRAHRDMTREMDRLDDLYRSVAVAGNAVAESRMDASSPVSASRE